ncbi:MAG: ribonuclease HII [Ilumatobacteraceae bacterium]|jgi:ribonuclease HII|nr:ribonuclease HII [Ilumatobacteraceae bacterium]
MRKSKPWPHASRERLLFESGAKTIVGIDEVGKGSWAGPLVIGIAMLSREMVFSDEPAVALGGVRDSKQLSELQREDIFDQVAARCSRWSIGAASALECDQLGMVEAQRLATARGFAALSVASVDVAIVDGRWDFVSPHARKVLVEVKADADCVSVAAASVLAKVSRDRMMRSLAGDYPQWHFDTNKGYPCPKHRAALQGYGPSAIHRTSWAFMPNYVPWLKLTS